MEACCVARCLDVSAWTGWVKATCPEVPFLTDDLRVGSRRCGRLAPWPWQVQQAQRPRPAAHVVLLLYRKLSLKKKMF